MDTVDKHGAKYHGDLTKAVSHLVAAVPQGKKYDYARQWNIRVVSLEWLQDSLERGMVLDESLYDPLLPKEERGKGAWNRIVPAPVILGKRQRDAEKSAAAVAESSKRKLKRTASLKLGSQSEAIWADITAGSFGGRQEDGDDWQETTGDSVTGERARHGPRTGLHQPSGSGDARSNIVAAHNNSRAASLLPKKRGGVFDGRITFAHGFDKAKVCCVICLRRLGLTILVDDYSPRSLTC